MNIENAPRPEDPDEDAECAICGREQSFVLYDGDKVCRECGYVPTGVGTGVSTNSIAEQWQEWFDHRASEYSGWHGEERVKFVGGFASSYQFDEDFD